MEICTSEQQYLNAIIEPVRQCCKRYGYLPSVLIAQSCLENGYGIPSYWDNPQIELLMKYNNMVGIKSELLSSSWSKYTAWEGESLNKDTPEQYGRGMVTINDNFRKYDTIERSFADYLLFLTYASNYGPGGKPKYGREVLDIRDPATLIKTVGARGYATGQTYPTSVMRIVNKHNLTQYDDLTGVQPTKYAPGGVIEGGTQQPVNVPTKQSIIKLATRTIHDIIKENLSQVPASRGSNKIQFIVVHYLGVPNADNPYLYGGGYGGHYNIKRDGNIYLAANPKTAVVWHCGGGLQGSSGHTFHKICTNYNSIGIECGVAANTTQKDLSGDSGLWYFTEETQESLVYLVSKLMDEYGISIDHVIRHYDVTGKICPNPYVKNNNYKTSWTWGQFKANLAQYRKDGTITIPDGNTPAPQPTPVPTPEPTPVSTSYPATPFFVTVLIDDLNIRSGPGTSYAAKGYTEKGIFTITETSGQWGKLLSGVGWIYLGNSSYCTIGTTTNTSSSTQTNTSTSKKKWKAIGTAIATANDLNVRETPNGKILRQVNKGNRFEVDGKKSGAWVHVNVAGTIGYIHKNYIKYD